MLLLLVIIFFIAIVSAQPDNTGYDPMELNWTDEWYNNVFGTLANDQLRRMVSRAAQAVSHAVHANIDKTNNPPPPFVDPSQLSQPFACDERVAHAMSGPAADLGNMRQPSPQGFGNGRTYAAALQHGIPSQPQMQMQIIPQEPAAEYFAPQQSTHAAPVMPSPPFARPSRTKTYAEALRSPPANQDTFGMGTFGAAHEGFMQSDNAAIPPTFLPTDITSNPNFHLGMTEPADTLSEWISQPRTARDRLRPTLDTTRLTPHPHSPSPSTARSPASITSPSSSRLSSVRRSKHQILHSPHSRHRCSTCSAGFDTRTDLTHHMRIHTPEGARPFGCRTCGKRFLYNKDLRRHELVHAAKRLFCPHVGCKFSARGFSRQDHLDRHLRGQHAVDSAVQGSWAGSSVMGL